LEREKKHFYLRILLTVRFSCREMSLFQLFSNVTARHTIPNVLLPAVTLVLLPHTDYVS
jgi:hypothetical protein